LIVRTNAIWTTHGIYDPNTTISRPDGVAGQRMTFDMTDIKRWNHDGVKMLTMTENAATGAIRLDDGVVGGAHAAFDAVLQHHAYLMNPTNDNVSPFITSKYELKRLDLGPITLADSVIIDQACSDRNLAGWNGNIVHANGHLTDQDKVDYFGYNAGLRRYFFDVYATQVDGTVGELMANNFHTADGYKTYLQGALATSQTLNQTFFNAVSPLINAAGDAPAGRTLLNSNITGSSIETETGSDVDVDGFSVGLALSHKFENDLGETTVGLFGEFGYGNYDTYTSIANFNYYGGRGELNGDGDTKHYGGGLFARHEFNSKTYLEGSFRAGGTNNSFELRRDTRFNRPYNHNYDSDRTYFGAHLGLGQKLELNELTLLDVYGKFLWTRTDSDSFTTDFVDWAGYREHVSVDAVDSIRHRVGGRLTRSNESGTFKGFVGLAWEHEYDGEAKGTIGHPARGYDPISNAPDVKGSSGFGELGLTYNPTDTNYSIDMSVFGLAGKQDGFGGTLGLKFEF